MVTRFSGLLIAVVLLMPLQARALMNGEELMRQSHAVMTHFDSFIADVALEIEAKGKIRQRSLQLMMRQSEAQRQLNAEFTAPAEVRNAGFTSRVNLIDGTAESWVYLPAVGKARKLDGANQSSSFFGSDFSYADISGRSLNKDSHRFVSEDSESYVVESIPKDAGDSYGRLVSRIAKEDMTIRSVTFYDRKGNELKRLDNLGFDVFDDVPVVSYSEMTNLKTGSVTRLTRGNLQVGVYLMDDDFGLGALSE